MGFKQVCIVIALQNLFLRSPVLALTSKWGKNHTFFFTHFYLHIMFSTTFHQQQVNLVAFPGSEIKIYNCRNFQVFYDLPTSDRITRKSMKSISTISAMIIFNLLLKILLLLLCQDGRVWDYCRLLCLDKSLPLLKDRNQNKLF